MCWWGRGRRPVAIETAFKQNAPSTPPPINTLSKKRVRELRIGCAFALPSSLVNLYPQYTPTLELTSSELSPILWIV